MVQLFALYVQVLPINYLSVCVDFFYVNVISFVCHVETSSCLPVLNQY